MTAPAPEVCDVCGKAPLELVLYPIAIHYKGSGFYSTDYGKGGKAAKTDDGGGGSSSGDSSSGDSKKSDAKPAGDTKPTTDSKPAAKSDS